MGNRRQDKGIPRQKPRIGDLVRFKFAKPLLSRPRPVGYIVGVMGIRIEVCYFEDAAAVRYGSWCERTQVEVISRANAQ